MEPLLELGLNSTRWLQTTFPFLAGIMVIISDLTFANLLTPIIFWSFDKRVGRFIVALAAYNGLLNDMGKALLRGPRPFWLDPALDLSGSSGYGIPSGHTQTTFISAITVSHWLRRSWVWVIALLFALLMGISRIYLGAHFVHDVIGAYLLGALALLLGWQWERRGKDWVKQRSWSQQLGLVAATTAVLLLGFLLMQQFIGPPNTAVSWATHLPLAEREAQEGVIASFGSILGIALGFLLERRYLNFQIAGSLRQRIGRIVVGLFTVSIIFYGIREITPDEPIMLSFTIRFFRYFLASFWIAYLAPLLFVKLGLAQTGSK